MRVGNVHLRDRINYEYHSRLDLFETRYHDEISNRRDPGTDRSKTPSGPKSAAAETQMQPVVQEVSNDQLKWK